MVSQRQVNAVPDERQGRFRPRTSGEQHLNVGLGRLLDVLDPPHAVSLEGLGKADEDVTVLPACNCDSCKDRRKEDELRGDIGTIS